MTLRATSDVILEGAEEALEAGFEVDEIRVGEKEIEDFREWVEPRYRGLVDLAHEAHLPFYWHGHRIVPSREQHEITLLAK